LAWTELRANQVRKEQQARWATRVQPELVRQVHQDHAERPAWVPAGFPAQAADQEQQAHKATMVQAARREVPAEPLVRKAQREPPARQAVRPAFRGPREPRA
jgi:hypothetical protein